ncbi:MAG: hypothetical protein Q4G68_14465 [Planctomycetia bacterium]|nr:hypothetical protein [Planctomycetia bacterium]
MLKGITDIDEGTIRRVDWQELIPASLLVRAFSLACSWPRILLATFVATLLHACYLRLVDVKSATVSVASLLQTSDQATCPVAFRLPTDGYGIVYLAVAALVVAIMGLAWSRSAAVAIASSSRVSLFGSLRYALAHLRALLGAICLPTVLILLLDLLMIFVRGDGGFGSGWLLTLLAPVVALVALVNTVLKLGLLLGFPLLVAAVAVDKCDAFDAVARMFSYVFQRPLHFVFYVLLAALFGAVGLAAATCVSEIAHASLTSGFVGKQSPATFSAAPWLQFWLNFLLILPLGFAFTYLVTAATAIYFMLRRSLDGTPIDVCYQNDAHRPKRSLAPVLQDEQGAPVLAEPAVQNPPVTHAESGGQGSPHAK